MKLEQPTPIIRIFDEEKAKEFYVDYLEFTVDWEHRFEPNMPLYMQVSKGKCKLHLSEHHGDSSPGITLRIPCDDVKGYHRMLSQKNYKYARPGVERQPWATEEMSIKDPFGNTLVLFKEAESE